MKLHGLKKAAGVTRNSSYRHGGRVQISLDMESGEIYTDYHVGENWSRYRDSGIVTVCFVYHPMTMAEIENAIDEAILTVYNEMYD